jgi:hypothetical protein
MTTTLKGAGMTPTKLIAYHGDPNLKAEIMAKIAAHRLADEIAKSPYVRTNDYTIVIELLEAAAPEEAAA